MSEKSDKPALKIRLSDTPTIFTDGVNIACRMDGGILLQFISETPDIIIENFRTVMVKDEAIEFLNNLAIALEHYPTEKPGKTLAVKAKKAVRVTK